MAIRIFCGQGARGRAWGWAWGNGGRIGAPSGRGYAALPAVRSMSSAALGLQSFSLDDEPGDYELPTFAQGPAAPPCSPPVQVRGRVGLPEVLPSLPPRSRTLVLRV